MGFEANAVTTAFVKLVLRLQVYEAIIDIIVYMIVRLKNKIILNLFLLITSYQSKTGQR